MKGVKIREIEERDENEVEKLVVETIFEYVPTGPFNKIDHKGFGEYHRSKGGEFFVADLEGEIIGCVGFIREGDGCAQLRRMYVKKGFRGKGVGKLLYDEAINLCKDKGYSNVLLFTLSEMKEAIAFYAKEGFVELKREGNKIYFEKSLE